MTGKDDRRAERDRTCPDLSFPAVGGNVITKVSCQTPVKGRDNEKLHAKRGSSLIPHPSSLILPFHPPYNDVTVRRKRKRYGT
jgi:hypothetical protein